MNKCILPPTTNKREAPTVPELAMGFFLLGIIGFGGVLPLTRRMVVEKRRWLSGDEFTNLLGLCQFLPGGTSINLSVALGLKFRGVPGALASILGLIAAPVTIVVGLGAVYDRFGSDPLLRHLFAGLAAAAAGLLISMAVKISWPLRRDLGGLVVAALCVIAIAGLRLPLLPTMLIMAPVSILIAKRPAS